jgi:hypothetical protein
MNHNRRKTVCFRLDTSEIHPVTRIEDMPRTEVTATWYDDVDYRVIKSEISLTLKVFQAGCKFPERTGLCYRGLEWQMNSSRRNMDMFRAVQSTLSEQRRQRREGVNDPEMLATVYHGYTILCSESALRKARVDGKAAAMASMEDDGGEGEPQLRRRSLLQALFQHQQDSQQESCTMPMRTTKNLCLEDKTTRNRRSSLFVAGRIQRWLRSNNSTR